MKYFGQWRWTGLTLLTLAIALVGCGQTPQATVVVGSKNFTEQIILGELLAQQIEATTDLRVERRLNLGGTFVCHEGLKAGELDLYPEYTGTAYSAILKLPPLKDPAAVYQKVQTVYREQFNLEWAAPLGFNNTFAMVIRGEEARRLNLTTLSDAVPYMPQWKAGFGYEFMERADGFPGLAETYGIQLAAPPLTMDLGLIYRALTAKQVDMVAGNSTDGVLSRLDLVALEDDRQYFPPYEAAPIVRQQTLDQYPELRQSLQALGSQITAAEMQQLNDRVDSQKAAIPEVVREFLATKQLDIAE